MYFRVGSKAKHGKLSIHFTSIVIIIEACTVKNFMERNLLSLTLSSEFTIPFNLLSYMSNLKSSVRCTIITSTAIPKEIMLTARKQ